MKQWIKAGFGIYIGWEIAKQLDIALGKVLTNRISKKKSEDETDESTK